jgi:low density lipoprotein receptor-related protein 5/6
MKLILMRQFFLFFSGSPDHPCLTNRGGCSHICIPLGANQRKCGCSVGYTIGETETECKQYTAFAVVSQLKSARGFDLTNSAEAMVPISGKGNFIVCSETLSISTSVTR